MSHPDPSAPADRRPIEIGESLENPATRERAVVLELPWHNPEGRAVAEMTALPGARVIGEHLHPALHERFSVYPSLSRTTPAPRTPHPASV